MSNENVPVKLLEVALESCEGIIKEAKLMFEFLKEHNLLSKYMDWCIKRTGEKHDD